MNQHHTAIIAKQKVQPVNKIAGYFSAVLLIGLILFNPSTLAQTPNCNDNTYRQFDFWLGKWVVTDPQGKIVGHNEIKRIHNGCALHENWRSVTGFTGSSLNTFNKAMQQWHQTWVDSSGGLLRLSGHYQHGKMVLSDQHHFNPKAEKPLINRISWQALKDGNVRQIWETSEGPDKAWNTVFNGLYSRQSSQPPAKTP